jgi:hypothetical protein
MLAKNNPPTRIASNSLSDNRGNLITKEEGELGEYLKFFVKKL